MLFLELLSFLERPEDHMTDHCKACEAEKLRDIEKQRIVPVIAYVNIIITVICENWVFVKDHEYQEAHYEHRSVNYVAHG